MNCSHEFRFFVLIRRFFQRSFKTIFLYCLDANSLKEYDSFNYSNNLIVILIKRSRGTGPMTLQQPAKWSGANSSGEIL